MIGFCTKCKDKVQVVHQRAITMKNGKPATDGECPTCGTRVFRLGPPDHDEHDHTPGRTAE